MSIKRDQAQGNANNVATPFLATLDALTVQAGDLIGVSVGWITNSGATATVVDNFGGNVLASAGVKRTHSNNDMCEQMFWGIAQASGTINPRVDFAGGSPLYVNIKAYSASGSGGWSLGSIASDQNTIGTSATTPPATYTGISGSFVMYSVQTYGTRVITEGANFGNPPEFGGSELSLFYNTILTGTGSIAGLATWSQTIPWMASITVFEETALVVPTSNVQILTFF